MSLKMTPTLARESTEALKGASLKAYGKLGLSQETYHQEIVTGALLPWKHFGPKAKCLEWFREEVGIKPAEKYEIEHGGNVTFEVINYAGKGNGKGKRKGGNGSG